MEQELYREIILDHYRNPKNFGELSEPDISESELNPLCGDKIQLHAKIANKKIQAIKFRGNGCAISQASASVLTEYVKGKSLQEVEKLGPEDVLDLLKINPPPARLKCATLVLSVLKKGLRNYKL
ncbi:MAG: SUF system NifU family Fe-S cluster assembly protein [Candidatus Woykebacteria bacterium RBG_13_40_7b]|uniref:SUF system NifU family Fe-S cluster assembly protein n=1 Tax=Candidatus Woykebacteria bacterium RBG_13_40_7b TaxID=1802594 RepID=A0A1G1WBK8_9BACT|nr:MAG: SUF system NifU family Fe-S cluster assembly protein [Candidatus Woykebacteria bacterium RBG_13_40_7b]